MRRSFHPVWALLVAALLIGGALFVWRGEPGGVEAARGHIGVIAAAFVGLIPLRRVTGARLVAVLAFAAAMAVCVLGVSAAQEGRTWGWPVAGAGVVAIFASIAPSALAVFGKKPGLLYLAALFALAVAALAFAPFAVKQGGARVGYAAAGAAVVLLAMLVVVTRESPAPPSASPRS